MSNVANLVQETTTTSGTGAITLTAQPGFARFLDRFPNGTAVYYALRDGNNWEVGIGTINTGHTLTRTTPLETFVSGVLDDTSPAAINLSGGTTIVRGAVVTQYFGTMARENTPLDLTKGGTGATNAGSARTNLGLGTMAQLNAPLGLANGGTGGTDAASAKAALGITYADITGTPPNAGKQSIWIPASAMVPRTTNPPASGTVETTTNRRMIVSLDFDPTTEEFAQFAVNMPKSWNEGTMTAVFWWSHAATATNFGVVWKLKAAASGDDDPLDSAWGTAVTVTDTGGTTNDIYRTAETGNMTAAGSPAENDVVYFEVSRDAANGSDNLAIDARLIGVMLFITTNAGTDA